MVYSSPKTNVYIFILLENFAFVLIKYFKKFGH
uniref:Uncharacterized protein n=1 Tax=Anguilla anguilla TaxID=7936 RepID=A0A0E9TDJ1_ANGAN